ncbi:unnamed protein product [Clavelina lepadiformis]|uniref:TLC domain-containing protein n=1 Tax=Clavelina lepadiformis TaxID=159417 RepID=A0ABP0G6Y7_CLALP
MERATLITLEIVGWILCNLIEMNFVTPLLSRLMLQHFDSYNEERKKEILLKFKSLLYFLKIAYSIIAFLILTDDKIRESINHWSYLDFYEWILVMIVSYSLADILTHLFWSMKREPWQYLHHIYGIAIGGFVILMNETLLSSVSFNLMPHVFAPFTGLLAYNDLRLNEDKYFRGYANLCLAAYVVSQACTIPNHYYRLLLRAQELDDKFLMYYIAGGTALDFASFYSFVIICNIYWRKQESQGKKNKDD